MSGRTRRSDETKCMFFNRRWQKNLTKLIIKPAVKSTVVFDSERVEGENYLKTKKKSYESKINTIS